MCITRMLAGCLCLVFLNGCRMQPVKPDAGYSGQLWLTVSNQQPLQIHGSQKLRCASGLYRQYFRIIKGRILSLSDHLLGSVGADGRLYLQQFVDTAGKDQLEIQARLKERQVSGQMTYLRNGVRGCVSQVKGYMLMAGIK